MTLKEVLEGLAPDEMLRVVIEQKIVYLDGPADVFVKCAPKLERDYRKDHPGMLSGIPWLERRVIHHYPSSDGAYHIYVSRTA